MGYKHKNDIKDFMWSMFWMTHEVQKARAERKNVLDQFKKHVITSKAAMDGLRRCDEVLAQLQKKRKRAKKS